MARLRIYIDPVQNKFVIFVLVILVLYSFILFSVTLISPTLDAPTAADIEERWEAGNRFVTLLDQLWPTLLISIVFFVIATLFITHKFAGPIYRLKLTLRQVIQGDLSSRLKFRAGDDFQELADLVNKMMDQQRQLLTQINERQNELKMALTRAEARDSTPDEMRESFGLVKQASEKMQDTLDQFQLEKSAP